MAELSLNQNALRLAEEVVARADELRVAVHELPGGARGIDCGIDVLGGIEAGIWLARVCLAGLAEIALVRGEIAGMPCASVQVVTDHPVAACLASQYAGWQVSVGKFFAMGSGPMRAAAGREELFDKIGLREQAGVAVGILETRQLPDAAVIDYLAERTGVAPEGLTLLLAPTASQAGCVQVVARSVETALHKLLEENFDVTRIQSGYGSAPLPPVAADDLTAVGRTNDAILYGARVVLRARGDDTSLQSVGPRIPSCASYDYGAPFSEIFRRYDHDFYKIDPGLFSPAELVLENLDTGRTHHFGRTDTGMLHVSFYAI